MRFSQISFSTFFQILRFSQKRLNSLFFIFEKIGGFRVVSPGGGGVTEGDKGVDRQKRFP